MQNPAVRRILILVGAIVVAALLITFIVMATLHIGLFAGHSNSTTTTNGQSNISSSDKSPVDGSSDSSDGTSSTSSTGTTSNTGSSSTTQTTGTIPSTGPSDTSTILLIAAALAAASYTGVRVAAARKN